MKYNVKKLDARYSYDDFFDYCIEFYPRMSAGRGPESFTQAQQWFVETYGWSAEVRLWAELSKWRGWGGKITTQLDLSDYCNPLWSYSIENANLRIYVASEKELMFFQLSHPCNK
jgi:hypothetical protein